MWDRPEVPQQLQAFMYKGKECVVYTLYHYEAHLPAERN